MEDTYKTTDLGMAAYLQISGVRLIDVEHPEPGSGRRFSIFVFDGEAARLCRRRWMTGDDTVSASKYAHAMRLLKNVVMDRI